MAKKKSKKIVVTEVEEKEEKTKEEKQQVNVNIPEKNNSFLFISIIIALIGIIFIFIPKEINNLIGYIIGGILILAGILIGVKYFYSKEKQSVFSIISAILYAALGIIIVIFPDIIMKLATIIFGVYLIVNGTIKFYNGIISKDITDNHWKVSLISGALTLVFGVILIINPFDKFNVTQIAGGFLLVVSLYDIIDHLVYKK